MWLHQAKRWRAFTGSEAVLRTGEGWDDLVDRWAGGEGHCCRLLVGMQSTPSEELRQAMRIPLGGQSLAESLDNQTALREKRRLAAVVERLFVAILVLVQAADVPERIGLGPLVAGLHRGLLRRTECLEGL